MAKMQIADVYLVHDDKGSGIHKTDVTPAEALYLNTVRKRHKDDTEKKIKHIHNVREVDRSAVEEKARLVGIYGETDRKTNDKMIEKVFPGESPNLPMTFKDAQFVVDNTKPEEGRRFIYPDIETLEKNVRLAEDTDELGDDVEALKKLVEAQGAQIKELLATKKA